MVVDRTPAFIGLLATKTARDLKSEHFAFKARAKKAGTKDELVYATDALGLIGAIGAFLFGEGWYER